MVNASTKLPLWLRLTLFGSLAVNLTVLGLMAGLAWHFASSGPRPAPIGEAGGAYTHALDPADRRALFQRLRSERRALPSRGDAQASFAAVLAALRADPFVAQDLHQAMMAQHEMFAHRAAAGQRVLIDHLSQMSAAERAEYAERLEHAINHRRPGSSRPNR